MVLLSHYYQTLARSCHRQWRLDAASHLASICSQQPCFRDLSEPVTREAGTLGQRPTEPTLLHSHPGSCQSRSLVPVFSEVGQTSLPPACPSLTSPALPCPLALTHSLTSHSSCSLGRVRTGCLGSGPAGPSSACSRWGWGTWEDCSDLLSSGFPPSLLHPTGQARGELQSTSQLHPRGAQPGDAEAKWGTMRGEGCYPYSC